jgi:hypothetical protein
MTDVRGIVGSVSSPSKTRAAVEGTLDGAAAAGGSYLHGDHFAETDDGYAVVDDGTSERLGRMGRATADLAAALDDSDAFSSLGPQV